MICYMAPYVSLLRPATPTSINPMTVQAGLPSLPFFLSHVPPIFLLVSILCKSICQSGQPSQGCLSQDEVLEGAVTRAPSSSPSWVISLPSLSPPPPQSPLFCSPLLLFPPLSISPPPSLLPPSSPPLPLFLFPFVLPLPPPHSLAHPPASYSSDAES